MEKNTIYQTFEPRCHKDQDNVGSHSSSSNVLPASVCICHAVESFPAMVVVHACAPVEEAWCKYRAHLDMTLTSLRCWSTRQ